MKIIDGNVIYSISDSFCLIKNTWYHDNFYVEKAINNWYAYFTKEEKLELYNLLVSSNLKPINEIQKMLFARYNPLKDVYLLFNSTIYPCFIYDNDIHNKTNVVLRVCHELPFTNNN